MLDASLCKYMEERLRNAAADLDMPDSYYEKAITAHNSLSTF